MIFPAKRVPGDPNSMQLKGKPVADTPQNRNRADLDYNGRPMPPPEAVAGNYTTPDGKKIKVEPLSDEDRRTIVRWIDLGCPIDLDYDPAHPDRLGYGWMCDDNRPVLTVTYPERTDNDSLSRILVGMSDYGSGLALDSFQVRADFPIDDAAAGEDVSKRFVNAAPGVWELRLSKPIDKLSRGTLTVSVKDRAGNLSRVERTFSIGH